VEDTPQVLIDLIAKLALAEAQRRLGLVDDPASPGAREQGRGRPRLADSA
jgi:hypothetical protein